MARRRTWLRVLRIQRVLVKYGLDEVIAATHLLRPLRFLFYLFPRRRNSSAPLGERIRLALEELILGPIDNGPRVPRSGACELRGGNHVPAHMHADGTESLQHL